MQPRFTRGLRKLQWVMLGLGLNAAHASRIGVSSVFEYAGDMSNWSSAYAVSLYGPNTGITSSYFNFTGWLNLDNHATSFLNEQDTGMTVDVTYRNIKLGTSYQSVAETVYGSSNHKGFKIYLDQAKLNQSTYDAIRSASSGGDAEILPSSFAASTTQSDNTAIDLSFYGSFSNSFEIDLTLYSVYGVEISTSSTGPFYGNFAISIDAFDLYFPVRAVNESAPFKTESRANIAIQNSVNGSSISITDVPIWLDITDTFNVRDKNGDLINITSNFVYTDSNGVDQTVDLTPLDGNVDFISINLSESAEGVEGFRSISTAILIS